MTPLEVFQLYRRERRGQRINGYELEEFPHLSRFTPSQVGPRGFVFFADLPAGMEETLIEEQIHYFAQRGQKFEWKLYEYDCPSTLQTLLERRGFACEAAEAFLTRPVVNWPRNQKSLPGVRIEKIFDDRGLRDLVATAEAIWSPDNEARFELYSRNLREAPESTSYYCAYLDDRPVGTGRIEFPAGSSFADLFGGGIRAEARGRGIYSALLDRRILEAESRGYRYVAIDAAPMSRPILLKKGFQHVCFTRPMCLLPPDALPQR